MQRGEVFRFKIPKGLGHEQHGVRFGVVVQADEFLPRSVVIVAPTSPSARRASFRPPVEVEGEATLCSSSSLVRWMCSVSGSGRGASASRRCGVSTRLSRRISV